MTEPTPRKVERQARLRWIPIAKMRVNPMAQRELNQARVDRMAANFDPEQIGTPTVNERDGSFWIIDGHHRVRMLEAIGWGDQQIQCSTYEGLTSEEEAETFLKLNDVLSVTAMARYKIGVEAGRPTETDVDRIVRAQGLIVTTDKSEGAIRASGTLVKVYNRDGAETLARTLRVIRDSYGTPGLEAPVIDGIGLLCGRYIATLDEEKAVRQLGSLHGGVKGLLGRAEDLRHRTGNPKAQCVAAVAVEVINRGRGGVKLMSWWKSEAAA